MAEIIADLLHRQTVVEQMLRYAMAQRVRTAALSRDADPVETTSDDVRYRSRAQRTDRGVQREEKRSLGARGPQLTQITQDRLSDAARETPRRSPNRGQDRVRPCERACAKTTAAEVAPRGAQPPPLRSPRAQSSLGRSKPSLRPTTPAEIRQAASRPNPHPRCRQQLHPWPVA